MLAMIVCMTAYADENELLNRNELMQDLKGNVEALFLQGMEIEEHFATYRNSSQAQPGSDVFGNNPVTQHTIADNFQ